MDFFHRLLYLGKFKILKFKPVTNVNTKGKQCNCDFRCNSGLIVFDKGIITANIYNCAEHSILLFKNPPLGYQGRVNAS